METDKQTYRQTDIVSYRAAIKLNMLPKLPKLYFLLTLAIEIWMVNVSLRLCFLCDILASKLKKMLKCYTEIKALALSCGTCNPELLKTWSSIQSACRVVSPRLYLINYNLQSQSVTSSVLTFSLAVFSNQTKIIKIINRYFINQYIIK